MIAANSAYAGITMLDGSMSGLREVGSMGSILRVRAGPLRDIKRLKTIGNLFGQISYAIDAPKLYVGRGQEDRQVGDRIRSEAGADCQVYLIYSADPRFDMRIASYIEARLIEHADHLSIPLANGNRPYGSAIQPCPDLEQLVQQVLRLLAAAGLRRFEEAERNRPERPVRIAATGDLHDVRIVERDAVKVPPGAVRMKLMCRDLHAEGVATGIGKRFLVLPDADFPHVTKTGLSPENDRRRDGIVRLGVLEAVTGLTDRARLIVGLDCKTPAIAAKIVSGEHIGTRAWVRAEGRARS